jgi:hypothetical protein
LKDYSRALVHFEKALMYRNLSEAGRIKKIIFSIQEKNGGKGRKGLI